MSLHEEFLYLKAVLISKLATFSHIHEVIFIHKICRYSNFQKKWQFLFKYQEIEQTFSFSHKGKKSLNVTKIVIFLDLTFTENSLWKRNWLYSRYPKLKKNEKLRLIHWHLSCNVYKFDTFPYENDFINVTNLHVVEWERK